MSIKMLINAVEKEEYRVALVKGDILEDFYIETAATEEKVGNIYKGVVEGVEPSLQACFVNFGSDKNGFLSVNEVHPEYYQGGYDKTKDRAVPPPPIEKILKKGQELLIQVVKEMPGRKGAQLTTYLSFASRYLVLMPGGSGGVSRQIEDEQERDRLKLVMSKLNIPEGIGVIVRTAAFKKSKRELSKDLNRLLRMWKELKTEVKDAAIPSLVHKEQDVCLRTLRDHFSGEVSEVIVDDKETFSKVKVYMKIVSPRHQNRVKLYKGSDPVFAHYGVEKQIEAIYANRVKLKSGGSIVIDSTEALVSIDVNSGRGRGAKNIESTAHRTNIEAASEIARQLRLRDMGGLIVIDFIDMKDKEHIREVEKVFRDEAKKDRAKISASHISKFGLLELSRQRLHPSIESRSYQTCRYCHGRGLVLSVESAAVSFLRQIWMGASKKGIIQVTGVLPIEVTNYLQNRKRKEISELETRYGVEIFLQGDPGLSPDSGNLEFKKA
jgi:ribonuclease E